LGWRESASTGSSVTHPGNLAQNAQDYLNPKSETRISKQIENPNVGKNSNLRRQDCFFLSFPLLCCFGFRVLRFGFPGEVFGSGFAGLGSAPRCEQRISPLIFRRLAAV
jgi:hypothetical protein